MNNEEVCEICNTNEFTPIEVVDGKLVCQGCYDWSYFYSEDGEE